ncbi:ferrous iron transport protein A [Corynebacterium aquatimens]|uniref:FeoA family protein n=1 Tax=Corynebacterium TaxID=1716 RepID=UPI001F23DD2A|nr:MULTISPECIES: FeoA family protein [Corynebacterium]QYH20317.1 ferrous iron transport protein A [Corynebacterium aquatimens]UIZ92411.1 ferrous iron transport protein A [Corynebacterium sp. CNCTC7651]
MAAATERTLFDVPIGDHAVITAAMVDAKLDRRLRELGLRSGAEVTVMQKTAGGGRVVKVRDTHYALDKYALKHILVDVKEPAR